MGWRVELSPGVERELRGLESRVRARILRAFIRLETDQRPPGAKKLKGADDLWRVRVGDYRIVYQIQNLILVVLVVRIAHRREAYR